MPRIRIRENRLNGIFPLSYMGVIPVSPQNFMMADAAPTSADAKNFYIGDLWLDTSSDTPAGGYVPPAIDNLYILVSLDRGVATWIPFGGGSGTVISLSGNTGTNPVTPLAGNINVFGDGVGINISGDGVHTLTASLVGGGIAAQSFPTDSGTATPNGSGVLNIIAGLAADNCGSSVFFTGSGNTVEFNVTDANNNTIIGKSAGSATLTGTNNIVLGKSAGTNLTGTESNNLIIGFAGVAATNNQIQVSFPGASIPFLHNYGGNTFVGASGNLTLSLGTAVNNIGVGGGLQHITTAHNNVSVGAAALQACTTSTGNTAIGAAPLQALTSGNGQNVAIGDGSLNLLTTGSQNTAAGFQSGLNLLTGTNNTILGFSSGSGYTSSESSNILIQNIGVASESNVIRIGTQGSSAGQQNKAFMAGVYNVTPGIPSPKPVVIDSSGQLGTGTGGTDPAGANNFFAYINTSVTGFGTGGVFVTIPFANTLFINGGGYNTGTSVFTAPTTGFYQFYCAVSGSNFANTTTEYTVQFVVTGASAGSYLFININPFASQAIISGSAADNTIGTNQSLFIPMTATDTIKVQLLVGPTGGATTTLLGLDSGQYRCVFNGYQVA